MADLREILEKTEVFASRRQRATKRRKELEMQRLDNITKKEWSEVCKFNRDLLNEFIDVNVELSPKTLAAYYSNLRIWFVWVKDNLENKEQIKLRPLDYKKFQNWLMKRGTSSSDINNKRSAISSLNNFLEVYHQDDYPEFRNFVNKSIKRPPTSFVHEKQPLSKAEFAHLIEVLEEYEEWEKIAYLKFTLCTGCRRGESRQVLKELVNAVPIEKNRIIEQPDGTERIEKFWVYQTHPIRCKGRGETGKVRRLTFDQDAMDAMKKWIEVRGEDDCPYMFTTKINGEVRQVSESAFNSWSKTTFEPIIGRRFHPHLLRESRATQAVVEDGKDINMVRALLGHESTETTEIYVIRNDEDNIDDLF